MSPLRRPSRLQNLNDVKYRQGQNALRSGAHFLWIKRPVYFVLNTSEWRIILIDRIMSDIDSVFTIIYKNQRGVYA